MKQTRNTARLLDLRTIAFGDRKREREAFWMTAASKSHLAGQQRRKEGTKRFRRMGG